MSRILPDLVTLLTPLVKYKHYTQALVILSLNAAKAALIQIQPRSGGWAIVPSHSLALFDPNAILECLEFNQWRNTESLSKPEEFRKDLTSRGVSRLVYWKHAKSGYIVHGICVLLRDVDVDSSNIPPGPPEISKTASGKAFYGQAPTCLP